MTHSEPASSTAIDAAGPLDAPPIVLVHGSVVSRKVWLPQLRSLSDVHRVIAPDLPGHGELAATPWMRHGWLRHSPERTAERTRRIFPPALADVAEEQLRAGVHAEPLADAYTAMAAKDWCALVAQIQAPILIVNGERDSMARRGGEGLPRGRAGDEGRNHRRRGPRLQPRSARGVRSRAARLRPIDRRDLIS